MATQRPCEECGAELPANAPQGLCPRCLVSMGVSLAGSESAHVSAESEIRKSEIGSKVRYFGDYELLEEIARGGMGIVYRARQVSLNRIVAVKMLLFGKFSSDEFVQRFQTEAQAVASLQHPNIVAIHEVGEHEGQHYFSMDYIEGKSLAELVRENPLPTRLAASYIKTIAEAIHYAHQHSVLHRDLKPSNVLIDEFDQPRITDFGLAKQLKGDSELTVTGQVLGSPNFMPPEQADAKHGTMGAQSDVYSLGAILYHLLTGRPPFVAETLEDTLRQLLNNEPVSPRLLNASVPRDLETICLKCLEKEPAGRYQNAKELAEELDRFRNDETINARPISRPERVWRWCRRRPVVASLIVALHLVFATGLAGILWQWQQAKASQKKSETEAAKATAISDFLQQMLGSANPYALKGSEYTVRQLLDDFSAGLTNRLDGQPEVEASVRATIGKAYSGLDVPGKAQEHFERVLTLRRRIFGEQSEQVAETLEDYAWTFFQQGQHAKGELYAREALENYRKHGTSGQPVIAALLVLQRLVSAQGRSADVEAVTKEALTIAGKSPGVEFPDIASMIHGLAELKLGQSQYSAAEPLAKEAVEMHRRTRGAEHPEFAWALLRLASALRGQQKLTEAEAAVRESLKIFRKQYSFGHKSVDAAIDELRWVLEAKGDSTALEALYREVLTWQRTALGNDSPAEAEMLSSLAGSLQSQGKQAEAEKRFREAMEIILKLRGQDIARLPPVVRRLAEVRKRQGKSQDAEKLYEETIQVARQALGESHPALGEMLHDYGYFLLYQAGKPGTAAEQYLEALEIYRANKDDEALIWTMRELGDALVAVGKPKDAEPYLRQAVALYRKSHQQEDIYGTAYPLMRLGDALFQQQKLPEAEQLYREALVAYSKTQGIGGNDYTRTAQTLVRLLMSENKLAEAETLLKDLLSQQRQSPGDQHLTVTLTLLQLADVLKTQNKTDEAVNRFREALEIASNLHADATNAMSVNQVSWELVTREEPTSWEAAVAVELARKAVEATQRKNPRILDSLAAAHAAAGQFTNAIGIQQEAVALLQNEQEKKDYESRLKLYENNSPYRDQVWLAGLASARMRDGKFAEAETLLREDLSRVRKVSTNTPTGELSSLGVALHHLAEVLRERKSLNEARSLAEEAVNMYQRHPDWPSNEREHAIWVLADVLEALDDFVSLEPVLDEQLRILRPQFAPDDPELASLIAQLTRTLLAENKFTQAEPLARECLAIREKKLPDEWRAFSARSMLGGALLGQKKYAEAEPLLLSGYEGLMQREDKIPTEGKPRLKENLQRLVQLYEATGQSERATEWKQKLADFEKRPAEGER